MKYCRIKLKHIWSRHDQPQAHHAIECMQQRNVSHSTVGIVASGYAMPGSDIGSQF